MFIEFSVLVHGRSLSIANAYISTTCMRCRYSIQYSHLPIVSYYLINRLHFSLKLFDLKHTSVALTCVITYFALPLRRTVWLELRNFLTRFLLNNASFLVFEVGFENRGLTTACINGVCVVAVRVRIPTPLPDAFDFSSFHFLNCNFAPRWTSSKRETRCH